MATVIDSLLVTLGLDASSFTQGQKEATESLKKTENESNATAKRMEASGKQAGSFFSKIKDEVIGLGVAFLGFQAIKSFAVQITNADAATGRLSKNLKMSAQDLSMWEGAVKRAGGTAGDMDASLASIMKSVESMRFQGTASPDVMAALARTGIDPIKYLSAATPMTERLMMVHDKLSKMTASDAQYWGQQLGFTEKTVNLLIMNRSELEGILNLQREQNKLSKEDVTIATQRQKAWQDLSTTVSGFGRVVLNDLTPPLVDVLKILDMIVKGWRLIWDLPLILTGTEKHPTGSAAARTATGRIGGNNMLSLVQKLEGSGNNSVSPKGAIGRNQIMPATARQYGFDPSRLYEPAYNDQVAMTILADLKSRYGNDTDAILVAYNAGPGAANRFQRAGDNPSVLPMETQKYLAHAHALGAGGGGSSRTSTAETNINTINVNAPHATDADGIAKDMQSSLRRYDLSFQANSGLN